MPGGRQEVVALARLKPAHIDANDAVEDQSRRLDDARPPSPRRRGRPPGPHAQPPRPPQPPQPPQPAEEAAPRRRGRPPGSRNRKTNAGPIPAPPENDQSPSGSRTVSTSPSNPIRRSHRVRDISEFNSLHSQQKHTILRIRIGIEDLLQISSVNILSWQTFLYKLFLRQILRIRTSTRQGIKTEYCVGSKNRTSR